MRRRGVSGGRLEEGLCHARTCSAVSKTSKRRGAGWARRRPEGPPSRTTRVAPFSATSCATRMGARGAVPCEALRAQQPRLQRSLVLKQKRPRCHRHQWRRENHRPMRIHLGRPGLRDTNRPGIGRWLKSGSVAVHQPTLYVPAPSAQGPAVQLAQAAGPAIPPLGRPAAITRQALRQASSPITAAPPCRPSMRITLATLRALAYVSLESSAPAP